MMMRHSRQLRFYKNDVARGYTNPMRRWVYHYLFGVGVLASGAYVWGNYQLAGWEAARYPESGNHFCSATMLELLHILPFNYISHVFGRLSECVYFPISVHRFAIDAFIWWYGIDMTDAKEQKFSSLQEFFVREWKSETRQPAPVPVVVPSDGIVLSVQEDVVNERLVQVKGVTYSIRQLFHREMGPVAEGQKRVAIVVHLRTQDYHHVITPCSFSCNEVVYIPGALLPHTPAGYHWIPSLLPLNERVVLLGRVNNSNKDGCDSRDISAGNSCNNAVIGIAMVGGTLTGRIAIHIDGRVKTNFLNPPEYALHRRYTTPPLLHKGDMLSTFYWGSSVALVVDVPKSASVAVQTGDVVKAGEALITY